MIITKKVEGKQITLFVDGRVDTITSPQLQEEILKAFQKAKTVILDFAKVPYISSAGLRALLIGQKTAASKGASFELVNVTDVVMNVLETVGFSKILRIKR
jgi:anti-sigma B factor antagonist